MHTVVKNNCLQSLQVRLYYRHMKHNKNVVFYHKLFVKMDICKDAHLAGKDSVQAKLVI